jgi:hypothetical protein
MVLTQKEGTNLETKLLKVKARVKPKFFNLSLPISIPKPMILNVWPPLLKNWLPRGPKRHLALDESK